MFVYLRKKKIASVIATNVINDWYTSNDVLLMHMDNNATDVCGHKVNNTGVTFSSSFSKFGGYAANFNGASYFSIPHDSTLSLISGDFTLEAWIFTTATTGVILTKDGIMNASYPQYHIELVGGKLQGFLGNGTGISPSGTTFTGATTVTTNTWHHVAVVKSGTTCYGFLDGHQEWSGTAPTMYEGSKPVMIGYTNGQVSSSYFNGYIDEVRITKGLARYTSSFTAPTKAFDDPSNIDLYYDNNVLLCHFNSDLKDQMGHTFTSTYGTTSIVSTQSKFGGYSAQFNGSYLAGTSPDFAFGTGDFTIEFWMYRNYDQNQYIFTTGAVPDWGDQTGVQLLNFSGNLALCCGAGSNNALTPNPSMNTWHHIAIVRSGTAVKLYLDGTAMGAAITSATNLTGTNFAIGTGHNSYWFNLSAYIQDFRVTKGIARYTANFNPLLTVPNTSYEVANYDPFYDNVVLGMRFDNNFSDLAGNTATATNFTFSNSIYKFGSYSAYSSGAANTAITIPSSSILAGDFTVELWAYYTGAASGSTHSPMIATVGGPTSFHISAYFSDRTKLLVGMNGDNVSATGVLTPNTWMHVAVSRSGSTVRSFINGVLIQTITQAATGADTQIRIGSYDSSNVWVGYLDDIRVTKGVSRYNSAFTPVQQSFPYAKVPSNTYDSFAKQTVLLMHMEGSNSSSAFTDDCKNIVTATGSYLSTSKAKFGNSSAYFSGAAGSVVTVPYSSNFAFGANDFTLEAWVYPTAFNSNGGIVICNWHPSGATACAWQLGITTGGFVYLAYGSGSSNPTQISTTGAVPLNAWSHIAGVRFGNTFLVFANGTLLLSGALTGSLNAGDLPISIGGIQTYQSFSGYIDEVRVTRAARYTASFSVPTAAFPSPALSLADPTVLLMHLNDATEVKGKTVTNAGMVFNTNQAKFGTTSGYYAPYTKIQVNNTSDMVFGTGDFTVEGWFYPTAYNASTGTCLFSKNVSGSNNFLVVINTSGTMGFWLNASGASTQLNSTRYIALNQWSHVAAVRNNGIITLYVNGEAWCSQANAANITDQNPFSIGDYSFTSYYQGTFYVQEVRVSMACLYPTNFSVPTTSFADTTTDPYQQYTTLALHGDGAALASNTTFIDASTGALTITATGTPTQSAFSPFGSVGGSAYFNGTSDYLSIPASTNWVFSGDHTIEAWVYPLTAGVDMQIFGTGGSASNDQLGIKASATAGTAYMYYAYAVMNTYVTGLTIIPKTWNHIAVSRTSGVIKYFVNGALVYTLNTSVSIGQNLIASVARRSSDGLNVLNGYVSNLRVVKGSGLYTAAFTPSTSPLTAVAGTVLLLLNNNVAENSTNSIFLDSSFNTAPLTVTGTPTQGSLSPFSTNGYSAYFDGASYLTGAGTNTIGTQDFCIEAWINPSVIGTQGIIGNWSGNYAWLFYLSNGIPSIAINGSSYPVWGNTVITGKWTHIAITRQGNVWRCFQDGVLVNTATVALTISAMTSVTIGQYGGANYFSGQISNVRVVVGNAVYTSAFTPSITPLTAITGTLYLLFQSNRFKDNSSNNYALTITGTPKVVANTPFPRAANYSASTEGGSMYFNGTSDCVTTQAFTVSDSFTTECWIYPTTLTALQSVFGKRSTTASYGAFNVYFNSNATLNLLMSANNSTWDRNLASSIPCTVNSWNHIALVKNGTAVSLYINGTLGISTTISNLADSAYGIGVGAGAAAGGQFFNGHISNFRHVNGTAVYTSAFTPSTTPLTSITNTQVLLSGTNAGVIDSTGKNNVITVGSAQTSTSQSMFGSSSLKFSSTANDYLLIPNSQTLTIGSADFTIEAWVYPTALNTYNFILNHAAGSTNATTDFEWWMNASGNVVFSWFTGATALTNTSSGAVPLNAWTHVAVTRSSGYTRLYINGVADASLTYNAGINNILTSNYYVGNQYIGGRGLVGYMDDLRMTVGKARYAGNFTIPTKVFAISNTSEYSSRYSTDPYLANVTLDVTFDGASPTDSTGYNVITTTNVPCSSQQYMEGGAGYFSGTSSSFTALTNPAVTTSSAATGFGSGNFTIEMWFMPTAVVGGAYALLIDTRNVVNSATGICILYGTDYIPHVIYQGGQNDLTITTPLKVNAWNHLALVRNGSTLTLYLNGVSIGTTASFSRVLSDTSCLIGRSIDLTYGPIGFMDNLKITRGIARYIGNFDIYAKMVK